MLQKGYGQGQVDEFFQRKFAAPTQPTTTAEEDELGRWETWAQREIQANPRDSKYRNTIESLLDIKRQQFERGKPTPEEEERPFLLESAEMNLGKIDRAIELLEQGKVKTGGLAKQWYDIRKQWGGTSPEEDEFNNFIGKIVAHELVDLGGKVLPPHELDIFTRWQPKWNLDEKPNISALKSMKVDLVSEYQALGISKDRIKESKPHSLISPAPTRPEEPVVPGVPTQPVTGVAPPEAGPRDTEISPIIQQLAKAQEYLGRSQALPMFYGGVGRMATGAFGQPHLGAGVGTFIGERLKHAMARGGPEALIPTKEELGGEVSKGAAAAALSWSLPKIFQKGGPKAGVEQVSKGAIERAQTAGKTIPTAPLREKLGAYTPPWGTGAEFQKQAAQVLADVPEVLQPLQGYTQRQALSGAYIELNPAQEVGRRWLTEQLKQVAPTLKVTDPIYGKLAGLGGAVRGGLRTVGRYAVPYWLARNLLGRLPFGS